MRILLDQNVPRGLRDWLPEDDVTTADEAGWAKLSNGELLRSAEDAGYDVLLSADQSLSYQQSLKGRSLAIVVVTTNHWPSLRASANLVEDAVRRARAGTFELVEIARVRVPPV